jgi:hypothetical protein
MKEVPDAIARAGYDDATAGGARDRAQLGNHARTARVHLRDRSQVERKQPGSGELALCDRAQHGRAVLHDEPPATAEQTDVTGTNDLNLKLRGNHRVGSLQR